jgi:ABC-type branched-subunit amino acid transport system ATPase component
MSLDVVDVQVRFGGVTAVDRVSISVEPKQVLAVIGPNGSGKSTLFNAITGMVAAQQGSVRLDGQEISGLPADKRIRAGLARTFQTPRFDPEVTVRTAVICGYFPQVKAGLVSSFLRMPATARDEMRMRDEYEILVRSLGLSDLSDIPMGELPMGQIRLVEVARAIAAKPRYLLLDEPAAGLSSTEQTVLSDTIRTVVATGVGVVLVEHNFQLVRNIADHVVVLNRGTLLAEGDPGYIAAHPDVINVYLGSSSDQKPTAAAS